MLLITPLSTPRASRVEILWKRTVSAEFRANCKICKNASGQFIPNCPPKHVITSTNCIDALLHPKCIIASQMTFTRLKSSMETPKQFVKFVRS